MIFTLLPKFEFQDYYYNNQFKFSDFCNIKKYLNRKAYKAKKRGGRR